jgi:hypothetical protein
MDNQGPEAHNIDVPGPGGAELGGTSPDGTVVPRASWWSDAQSLPSYQ